jgi:hypothetical protein
MKGKVDENRTFLSPNNNYIIFIKEFFLHYLDLQMQSNHRYAGAHFLNFFWLFIFIFFLL